MRPRSIQRAQFRWLLPILLVTFLGGTFPATAFGASPKASPQPAASEPPQPKPATQPHPGHLKGNGPTPAGMLLPASGNGLNGAYTSGASSWGSGTTTWRIDPTIAFDWSFGHPFYPGDFSVAWTGQVLADTAGTYTFATSSDDGSMLAIDGALVVNNGGPHGQQTVQNFVYLDAGLHSIDVRYYECCGGPAVMYLYWTPPGGSGLSVVPQDHLFTSVGPTPEQTFGSGSDPWTNHPVNWQAEPVNSATGNYLNEVTDLSIPGRGFGLTLARTYNSLDTTVGPLGLGWSYSAFAHLGFDADGSVRFFAEDGAQLVFTSTGTGGFDLPQGGLARLSPISGGYELTRKDGMRLDFDGTGHRTSETDRHGNSQTFTYTGGDLTTITDTVGRTVTLAYDASHRLTLVTDPIGRTVGYAYNTNGHLATVTDLRGHTTTYTYDTAGRLATIVDQNGHTLVTNVYDPTTGRVSQQTDALGNVSTFGWDAANGISTVTDARGNTVSDVYTNGLLVETSDAYADSSLYAYDGNFNRTSVTDPDGHTSSFTYDALGNVLTVTAPAPLSYVQTNTYDTSSDLLTHTDGRGHTTTSTYDSAGNRTHVAYSDGSSTSATYNGSGEPVTSTDQRGNVTTFAYDGTGNLTAITTPPGEKTTMSYDGVGRPTSTVDPRGNVTGGNPALYTTTLAYDAADHVTSVTDPLGQTTLTAYDPAGNRTSVTDPLGHATTYAYDAGNHLTSVTDATAHTTTYTYDAATNLKTRTDANSHTTTYAYDAANRLISTTDPVGHVASVTYDHASNVATRTDANAKTTTYTYDALNRLTGITYADSSTAPVTYAYDANGNRTTMTDGAGTESFAYDTMNRLTSDTRGADVFAYTYDPAGNLLTRTYPGGTVTTYTYDADGRMASASVPTTTSTTVLSPTADAYVKNTNPSTNYGTATTLLVKNDPSSTIYRDYLRFDTSGIAGTVSDANLSLTSMTTSSDSGRHVCAALVPTTAWTETGITWSNAPTIASPAFACVTGNQSSGVAYAYDLGAGATTNGSLNVGLSQDTTTLTTLSSREGTKPPQLTVTTTNEPADHTAPTAPGGLTASAVSGAEIDLAWTPAVDNLGVQSYRVSRNGVVVATVASPAFADTGLAATTAYTYTVSAADAAGNVSGASGSAGATTLAANTYLVSPTADAYVKNTNPATNYGTDTSLLVKNDAASTIYHDFLKFTVPALPGTVASATLQLYSTTSSSDASRHVCAYPVTSTTWTETGITWSNAPAIGSSSLSCVVGNEPVGWYGYSLGSTITGPGTYAFALTQDTATLTTYASREGTNPPRLLVTVSPVADVTAPAAPTGVTATATSGRRVRLAWSAASDNIGVTRYLVARGGTVIGQTAGTVTSFADTSVVPTGSYSYTVVAADAAGNQSASSAAAAVTVPGLVTSYAYDPAGELLTTATPDGVTARRTYDRAGRLLEIANTELDGTLSRFTYAYDAAGNRVELSTSVGTTYYAYDVLNRLTSSCTAASCAPLGGAPLTCLACVAGTIARPVATVSPNPSDTLTTYAYDPVGNRASLTTYLGTTTSTYDAADRLTSSSGPGATTYTYDANGNERTAGSATYAYDLADRLVSATVGTTTVTYTWSGDGIRLSAATGTGAATTNFLVDRAMALPSVALERDGTGTLLRTELYGLGRISVINAVGGIAYEHTDALGSVTDLVGSSGVALGWTEYGPYGAVRSAGALPGIPADPFAFTGQYLDGTTGLYHMRARQYDPATGRFTAVDPVGRSTTDPYVAAYVYGDGNPARFTDPSGQCAGPLIIVCVAAAGAIVGGIIDVVGYAISSGSKATPAGFLGHAAVGAGGGAIVGLTGGGALFAELPALAATGFIATGGYVAGLEATAGDRLLGEPVTARTFATNVVGSVFAALIGPEATGSFLDDLGAAFLTRRGLLSNALSIGSELLKGGSANGVGTVGK